MTHDLPKLKKVGNGKFESTDEVTRTYDKASVEQEIDKMETRIDELEKQAGLKSLRSQLEKKKALLDKMKEKA